MLTKSCPVRAYGTMGERASSRMRMTNGTSLSRGRQAVRTTTTGAGGRGVTVIHCELTLSFE